jgi:DNA polymerase-3 subunit alpha
MGSFEKLQKEKEVTGIYISGHPLDDFELEIKNYTNTTFDDIERFRDKDVTCCMHG